MQIQNLGGKALGQVGGDARGAQHDKIEPPALVDDKNTRGSVIGDTEENIDGNAFLHGSSRAGSGSGRSVLHPELSRPAREMNFIG
jgi:hypothetical protein